MFLAVEQLNKKLSVNKEQLERIRDDDMLHWWIVHLWQGSSMGFTVEDTHVGGSGNSVRSLLGMPGISGQHDGWDKMTIMGHRPSRKPDTPKFKLCHQPLAPQVSISLTSGKGGTVWQRLGTPAPGQHKCTSLVYRMTKLFHRSWILSWEHWVVYITLVEKVKGCHYTKAWMPYSLIIY